MLLGIKFYTKSMRVGTIVLVLAVAQIGGLGPIEPADMDAAALLQKPAAIAWVAVLLVFTGGALFAAWATQGRPRESAAKLCSLTAVVSLTTVLGSSTSK